MAELSARLAHVPDRPLVAPPKVKPGTRIVKVPKYRNRKVEHNGIVFDSAKEARRWLELERMQAAGQISELRRQVAFELAPAVKLEGEPRKKPALRYVADSVYMQNGALVVEDVKSPITRKTAIFRAKKHLMATVQKIQIREV